MPRDQVGFQTPLESVYDVDGDAVHNPDPVIGAEIADSNTRDRAGFQTPLEALYDEGGVHNPNPVIGSPKTLACSGSAVSGLGGWVNADVSVSNPEGHRLARVTQWTIHLTASGKTWVDSSTVAWKRFLPSVMSASGSFEFKYDTDEIQHELIWPGYEFGIELGITNSHMWVLAVCITDIAMTVDILTGDIVSGTASFTSVGRVQPPFYFYSSPTRRERIDAGGVI